MDPENCGGGGHNHQSNLVIILWWWGTTECWTHLRPYRGLGGMHAHENVNQGSESDIAKHSTKRKIILKKETMN